MEYKHTALNLVLVSRKCRVENAFTPSGYLNDLPCLARLGTIVSLGNYRLKIVLVYRHLNPWCAVVMNTHFVRRTSSRLVWKRYTVSDNDFQRL